MARRSKTARFRNRNNDEGDQALPTKAPTSSKGGTSRSGASRRSSREPASRDDGGGRTQTRAGRDGKVQIACPNCHAEYRILPQNMDSKVKCSQCQRVFFPSAAMGGKRTAKATGNPTTIIGLGVAAVAIVVVGIAVAYSGDEPPKPPAALPKAIPLGNSTPQVKAAMRWANGIFKNQRYDVENHTAFEPVQDKLQIDPKQKYKQSFGQAILGRIPTPRPP